jgi:hypothetical protein
MSEVLKRNDKGSEIFKKEVVQKIFEQLQFRFILAKLPFFNPFSSEHRPIDFRT